MKVTYTKLEGSASRYGKWPAYEIAIDGVYAGTVQNQKSGCYSDWRITKNRAGAVNGTSYRSRREAVETLATMNVEA